jgi:energy-coupling factor transporter ATP-binding protein EcfA2
MSTSLFEIEDLVVERGGFRIDVPRLTIPAGRPTVILGPTAAGKTTLLAVLARIESAWLAGPGGERAKGRVLYHPTDGPPVDLLALGEGEIVDRRLRGGEIGLVLQANGLFTGRSVEENVAWPLRRGGFSREEARRRAEESLDRTGGPPADRPVARLSGGESKRLAVARALALRPRALLLDEPFTGLDPESLGAMIALVKDLPPETTPVVVTHQPRAVKALVGHVVLVRDGRVEWSGEAGEDEGRIERFLAEVAEERI